MPRAKAKKVEPPVIDTSGAGMRALAFFVIIAALTVMLVFVWKGLPSSTQKPPVTPVATSTQQTPENPEKISCESSGGQWVECASPCAPGEICAQVCVAKCMMPEKPATDCGPHGHWNGTVCLCGGIAGWSCPKDQVCGDYVPAPSNPDALGSCRPSSSEPAKPLRDRPAGMLCDDLNYICVDPKFAEQTLGSPIIVDGTGTAFENTISWRLLDGKGGELAKGNVIANAPDVGQPGPFEIRAFQLQIPSTATGIFQLLEYSAKDGSPIHVVNVPVKLSSTTMKTKFFMPGDISKDCSTVVPIEMDAPRSTLPVETALRQLLAVGPIMSSKKTSIPNGTSLVSLVVSKGTATVVFSPELDSGVAGSCLVTSIRAQIEQTLKQFSSVKNVVISAEGKTPETTLQP